MIDSLIDSYVIEPQVLGSLRLYVGRAPSSDWERGGRLLREADRLIKFLPIENISAAAGYFECAEWPKPPWVLVHSHPNMTWHGLSPGDVQVMKSYDLKTLGVYSPLVDKLSIWVLDEASQDGVREIPVRVRERRSTWVPSPRRPGRRR